MYIHGAFVNQIGDTITVHIVTNNDRTKEVEIGSDDAGLYFTDDPIEIESQVNDTFDHLLKYQASIKLLTSNFIPDFFCASARDAVVNIYKDDICIFAGYIEPQAYSQDYNETYDELDLSCIDVLSALQYSKYRNIGSAGILYNLVKADAGQRTFYDIVTEMLNGAASTLDIVGGHSIYYYYDGSKAVDSNAANHYNIFSKLSISELLFLGDKEDDTWRQDEVIEEILRYLNLHIVQDGFTFYIFDWATVKGSSDISWTAINDTTKTATTSRGTTTIETAIAADTDTTISVGEVFNQLLLTCKIESVESVIESPLDDDLLVSPYGNKQKYMTEYASDGEGVRAIKAFEAMVKGNSTDYDGGTVTNWYLQVMNNKQWAFPINGGATNFIDLYAQDNENQQVLPNLLRTMPGASIFALGKVAMKTDKNDNSPTSKVEMTNYLFVSVNGNGVDNDEAKTYPLDSDIKAHIPYAVYKGNTTGGVFSPSDDATTNYIVLSGKVILNPVMAVTDNYKILHDTQDWNTGLVPIWWHKTVPSRNNGDGRYYAQQWWKAATPSATAAWDESNNNGLVPFTGDGPEEYEFKYSAIGDSTDTISKIAVLACMLIIGDKCVVETGTAGQVSDFSWKTYKTREQCTSDDEYYQQCFTIGFDPKIGDKLVGTEFSLQNNISYTMGIDVEGIAIPIKKSDKISGQVKFMILGPVNTTWDVITRRHPTFFRHTKWSSSTVPLLAHVSSIILKSFEVKVYSDNGLVNNTGDNDLIYMSDTVETYVNKKDDLQMKINSALTTAECQALGVTDTVKLSTPFNVSTNEGLLTIYDYTKAASAKPEQIYVDSYYNEYHAPRVIMEQKLMDKAGIISLFRHYTHPALGKEFFVQGLGRNLMEGYADLQLKEVNV